LQRISATTPCRRFREGRRLVDIRLASLDTTQLEHLPPPNFTHLDNLIELKNAAIPIMVEKPLDTSLEKISEIVRFARQYPAPVLVDHVMRHAPIIRKARELIDRGKLGRICSFDFTQRTGIGMFHTFRRTQAGGGGYMIEKATHDLDVMLYLTGAKPLSVSMVSAQHVVGGNKPNDLTSLDCPDALECPYANLGKKNEVGKIKDITTLNKLCVFAKEVDVPDNEACLIRLSNGIFGTHSHTYFCSMPGHSRLYGVIGDKGALYITLAKAERYLGEIRFYPATFQNILQLCGGTVFPGLPVSASSKSVRSRVKGASARLKTQRISAPDSEKRRKESISGVSRSFSNEVRGPDPTAAWNAEIIFFIRARAASGTFRISPEIRGAPMKEVSKTSSASSGRTEISPWSSRSGGRAPMWR